MITDKEILFSGFIVLFENGSVLLQNKFGAVMAVDAPLAQGLEIGTNVNYVTFREITKTGDNLHCWALERA